MIGFVDNIDEFTLKNKNYRHVIFTTKQQQLVIMNIPFNVEIGMEIHKKTTQFIKIVKGTGIAEIGGESYDIYKGDVIIIPANTKHNIISNSKNGLQLYTIYSPPEHKQGLIQKNK